MTTFEGSSSITSKVTAFFWKAPTTITRFARDQITVHGICKLQRNIILPNCKWSPVPINAFFVFDDSPFLSLPHTIPHIFISQITPWYALLKKQILLSFHVDLLDAFWPISIRNEYFITHRLFMNGGVDETTALWLNSC